MTPWRSVKFLEQSGPNWGEEESDECQWVSYQVVCWLLWQSTNKNVCVNKNIVWNPIGFEPFFGICCSHSCPAPIPGKWSDHRRLMWIQEQIQMLDTDTRFLLHQLVFMHTVHLMFLVLLLVEVQCCDDALETCQVLILRVSYTVSPNQRVLLPNPTRLCMKTRNNRETEISRFES